MALYKYHYIELDTKRSPRISLQNIVAGETGNRLWITVTNNGDVIDMSEKEDDEFIYRVSLRIDSDLGTRRQDSDDPDGGITFIEANTGDHGKINILLSADSFTVGKNRCRLEIYSKRVEDDDTLICSAEWTFDADGNPTGENTGTTYPMMAYYEQLAKSWAVGGTGKRDGEDADNAMYYSDLARQAVEQGVVSPSVEEWLDENADRLALLKEYVTPEMYGAKGDGETDDSAAVQGAVDNANGKAVYFTAGKTYLVNSGIVVHNPSVIKMDGVLLYSGTGTALTIGDQSANTDKAYLDLNVKGDVLNRTTSRGVCLLNVTDSVVRLKSVECFGVGVELLGDTKGCAYNSIYIDKLYRNTVGIKLNSKNTNGYCNENKFFAGRFAITSSDVKSSSVGVLITSENNYMQNANVFYSPCMEGLGISVKIEKGVSNKFYDVRTEGTTTPFNISGDACVYNYMTVTSGVNANSKGVSVINSANIYEDAFEFLLSKFTYTLFDSGNMYDSAVNNAAGLSCKGFVSVNNGVVTKYAAGGSRDDVNKAVTIVANKPLLVHVNTVANKEFLIGACADTSYRYYVLMFNSADNVISSTAPKAYATGAYTVSSLTKTSSGALKDGYFSGANTTLPVILTVPQECVRACIGVIAASASTPVTLRKIIIKSIYPDVLAETDASDNPILSAIPTSTAKRGQIVINSDLTSATYGWLYDGSQWTALT